MKLKIIFIFIIIQLFGFCQIDYMFPIIKASSLNIVKFENKINWDWDRIIAMCALGISFISIIFTIIQVQIQRIHNRKTIKPIGRIRIGDYQDNIFVKIENNGVGPLIIKEILAKSKILETKTSFSSSAPPSSKIRNNSFGMRAGQARRGGQASDSSQLFVHQVDLGHGCLRTTGIPTGL